MPTNLGDLLKAAGLEASGAEPEEAPSEPSAGPEGPRFAAKVVLRSTRKGRGGKTVTEIQGVLSGREGLAKHLKKKLGVGATVDGELLVVQGDQRARLESLLQKAGAKQLVVS